MTNNISKKNFLSIYVPELEALGQELLTAMSELLAKYPDSKILAKPKSHVEKDFITYSPFVLESQWDQAPFPDDFTELQGKQYEVLNQKFILEIEDMFLKSRSKIVFNFIMKN